MDIFVVYCKQLIGQRDGVEINLVILDDKPTISIFSQLLIIVDGYQYLSELLADLHDKRYTSVEGIFFDLVDDGNCCQLAHVGCVEFSLIVFDVG